MWNLWCHVRSNPVGSDLGKGANTTVSFVHHYFHGQGLGKTSVHLHADNCTGQNKNNLFLWYLTWRVIHQLHHSINYFFLIACHTKFGPDRCFGLIKTSYKVNYVSSLYEFAQRHPALLELTWPSLLALTMAG